MDTAREQRVSYELRNEVYFRGVQLSQYPMCLRHLEFDKYWTNGYEVSTARERSVLKPGIVLQCDSPES